MDIRWEKMHKPDKGRKSQHHVHSKSMSTKCKARSPRQCGPGRIDREQQENVCPGSSTGVHAQHGHISDVSPSHKKKHKRTASLTDLRPEDKKKVANLIQELANLGSEKEKVEARLKKEREDFEGAIKDLVTDQKALLAERKAVQMELNSCQQMLNQLQEAVLHRPTSSSVLSSQRGDNPNNESITGVTSNNDNANQNTRSGFDGNSALDTYLNKHNSTQESMDVASEVESVTSEAVRNPRTSSTFIGEPHHTHRKERSSWLHSVISNGDGSDRNHSNATSTINYSRKDELVLERAKLIEEQRLLRQKLFEQEELLRRTQKLLYYKELEQEAGQHDQLSQHGRGYAQRPAANTTYTKHSSPPQIVHNTSYQSRRDDSRTGFSVGVQVDNGTFQPQLSDTVKPNQLTTHDHAVQTELPLQSTQHPAVQLSSHQIQLQSNPQENRTMVQSNPENSLNLGSERAGSANRVYIGNRLVPSPSNCITRNNSSMEKTIEKTSRLLESARKVIDGARSPQTVSSTRSTRRGILSNTSSSQVSKSSLSHCNHSYQVYTPRKSHRELFDDDASLATEINSESMVEGGDSPTETAAEVTELELLEDIFYVK